MAKAQTNEVKPSIFPSLRFRRLNSKRQEMPDPTPMAPPVGFKKQESMSDIVRKMVRTALQEHAVQQGYEPFEEADDFDIPDDPLDPQSRYEADFEGDAAAALRDPDPIEKQYGSVKEFLDANPEIASRIKTDPSEQLRPEPTPSHPSGGVGEELAIAPGETPPSPARASATPKGPSSSFGFLRRG